MPHYVAADGSAHQYSVNSINQRLAAIRSVMAEAVQQGYITHDTAAAFCYMKGLKVAANKERRNAHVRTLITRAEMRAIIGAPNKHYHGSRKYAPRAPVNVGDSWNTYQ